MKITIKPTKKETSIASAETGARALRNALSEKERAVLVVATGASQFDVLSHLVTLPDIDWHRVEGFHLDEYVGLPITHPASFRKYLWERFVRLLPQPLYAFHYIDAERDPKQEVERINALISQYTIDASFIGIGENGHLAFNDPPADFETYDPFILVKLDEACRRQQLGEGWFPTFEDVPQHAVSMSIHQIMQSRTIICTVPEARKAQAVQQALEGEISPMNPASMLRRHENCHLFLDENSARKIRMADSNRADSDRADS